MANFTKKFGIATLFIWVVAPIDKSFGFNHDFLPGSGMAMKEASDKHEPGERFLAVATTLGADGNGLLFPEDSLGRQKLSEERGTLHLGLGFKRIFHQRLKEHQSRV